MKPGSYTVYVVASPIDRSRYAREDFAIEDIEFLPSDKPAAETPLDPAVPAIAVGMGAVLGICTFRKHGKKE
jgi:hypothetical protein